MTKATKAAFIAMSCREHGCDADQAAIHRDQYLKHGWEAHPPTDFETWWNPTGTHEQSGASEGGHADAKRMWARPEPNGWARREYGLTAEAAWNVAVYRHQYEGWADAGRPDWEEPFISVALPLGEQAEYMRNILKTLRNVGKMPPPEVEEIPF